jgi:MinD-like ATPase involved in chromosome partitioning or flagellar assembly
VSELAVGLSFALAARSSVLLLDAHDDAPAISGRLGLGLEPNLRTAVDACAHGIGRERPWTVAVRAGAATVDVVPGHPSPVAATSVSTQDVLDVVDAARWTHDAVVVDLQAGTATAQALLERADAVVAVVVASPVGVVRGIDWMLGALGRSPAAPLHVAVNRAPRSRYRRDEIRAEIERAVRATSLRHCPDDPRVGVAAWEGDPVGRGAFRSACVRLAAELVPVTRSRWARA